MGFFPGLKGVLDQDLTTQISSNVQLKAKASVMAFDGYKPEESKLDQVFYSPYQRYKMLKPYLDSLKNQDEKKPKLSDEDRIKSIKEHFDALTSLTPQELNRDTANNAESESSDSENNDLDRHEPKAFQPKREKLMESPIESKRVKYEDKLGNVDFTQYSRGVKAGVKTFDPNRDFLNDKKKRFGGKINKSKKKSSQNRSYTYSKK